MTFTFHPAHAAACLVAAAALLAGTAPASAADAPAYIGVWSKRMEHCSTQQKRPGAPMLVTEKGFDQHDLHCSFEKIEPGSEGPRAWNVLADCTWKGTPTKMEMKWSVAGEALTITDKGGSNTLTRCAPPPPRPQQ